MTRARCVVALLLTSLVASFCATALAQSRVATLTDQLRDAGDFRVRTQAALALGASDDAAALRPLCAALDDDNQTVRSAAAAALGKLGRAEGVPCLKRHGDEPNASVKSVIERAIAGLEGAGKGLTAPPAPGPNDTFYVAIGPTTDKTGRGGDAVTALVRTAMQQKLLSLTGYAVAPPNESAAAGRKVLQHKKLKGFMLQTRIEPPKYDGGDLTVQVRVTLWSYPGKALQGEFSPKLTMSGVGTNDPSSEDNLIRMAIERAVDSFAMVASSTN